MRNSDSCFISDRVICFNRLTLARTILHNIHYAKLYIMINGA